MRCFPHGPIAGQASWVEGLQCLQSIAVKGFGLGTVIPSDIGGAEAGSTTVGQDLAIPAVRNLTDNHWARAAPRPLAIGSPQTFKSLCSDDAFPNSMLPRTFRSSDEQFLITSWSTVTTSTRNPMERRLKCPKILSHVAVLNDTNLKVRGGVA